MKRIIEITLMIILGAYWAYRGQDIETFGNWLNGICSVPVFGYVFWGLLILTALYLCLSFFWMLYKVASGQTLVNVFIIAAFILLIYFASDIIEKGNTLNKLTPYPILGWAFWALIVFFIYWQVLYPLVVFASLKRFHEQSIYDRAAIALEVLKINKREKKNVKKKETNEIENLSQQKKEREEEESLYVAILNSSQRMEEEKLRENLDKYNEIINKKAESIILNYSKITGIAAVVSRNKWIDSVALLYMQSRMIVELSKLYGGKPLPLFNFLCSAWILLSTGVYLILHGLLVENAEAVASNLAEVFAENLEEDLDVQADALKGSFSSTPFIGTVASVTSVILGPVLQASLACTNVYMTGKLFLWKIQGDSKACSYKSYLATRRKARLRMAKDLMKSAPSVSVFKKAISNGVKTMLKEDKEA